jgi:sialate O-acetylesterase
MRSQRALLLLACAMIAHATVARAEVTLSSIYADHMVLQRNLPVKVRGRADAGETVTVTFRGETRSATPDPFGRWEVVLPEGTAGGPFDMVIQGTNTIHLTDILVGDVWLASGQSNMEFYTSNTSNAAAELQAANLPDIRLFRVKVATSPYPLDDLSGRSWVASSTETAAEFSAVAFFFGKEIYADQKVPIGLIDSTYGGTVAEAWTSMRSLSEDASLMPVFATWSRTMDKAADVSVQKEFEDRQKELAKAQGKPEPSFRDHADLVSRNTPAVLYNAMIVPLTHFAIRGVIWYQGEANANVEQAPIYARLFQTLIQGWRSDWGEGDFPFLYVQLANLNTNQGDGWPELREAQRKVLALRNTAMAVTIDIGDPTNVHFKDKQDVGHRLALAARTIAYDEPIEYSGPLFRMSAPEEHGMRLWFDHSSTLVAKGGPLVGFEIAGADKKFIGADARIDGQCVVVSSKEVPDPIYVRYAWKDNPIGNLYNQAALPASPFQSQE